MPSSWQAFSYLADPERFFTKAHHRYGDIFVVNMLGDRWVILAHPDLVAQTFSYNPNQLDSGEALQVLRPIIGRQNLLLLNGQAHLQRRNVTLSALQVDRIRAHEPSIRQTIRNELATWPGNTAFRALPRMEAVTFSIMMDYVFGLERTARLQTLAHNLLGMLTWITDNRRLLVLFLAGSDRLINLPSFRQRIHDIDQAILTEISQRRSISTMPPDDVLSTLMQARDENGLALSDIELRDELITLLVAGHKNTATLLAWALHELAHNPTVQERLYTAPLVYLDAVIMETLRLRPPVPLVVRRLRVPLTIAGHNLPVGTNLGPCALLVHRRPDLYPEPLVFRPERFIDHRPPFHEWFPFGGAINRCPGANFARFEARIILEEIIQAIKVRPGHQRPERARPQAIVLVPARGTQIVIDRK